MPCQHYYGHYVPLCLCTYRNCTRLIIPLEASDRLLVPPYVCIGKFLKEHKRTLFDTGETTSVRVDKRTYYVVDVHVLEHILESYYRHMKLIN